jgi:hypothetical protein
MKGCFNDQTLFQSLNMTGTFDFRSVLNFSSIGQFNISASFDFSAFQAFQKDITDTTPATFGWTSTEEGTLNDATTCCPAVGAGADAGSFTGCNNVNSVGYSSACTAKQKLTWFKANVTNTINWMQTDVGAIDTEIGNLKGATVAFETSMASVQRQVGPLLAAVDNLKESGDCTFIADFYWNVKDILCSEMLPAVVNVSMVMMLAAVFSIPMIGCAIWMKVRLGTSKDETASAAVAPEKDAENPNLTNAESFENADGTYTETSAGGMEVQSPIHDALADLEVAGGNQPVYQVEEQYGGSDPYASADFTNADNEIAAPNFDEQGEGQAGEGEGGTMFL